MSGLWAQPVSKALSQNGMLAYVWQAREDRFEWAGNFNDFAASGSSPSNNEQFHRLLNPQYVPARLAALHSLLKDGDVLQVRYGLRRGDGGQVDVEETAELHTNEAGDCIVCGFIRRVQAEAQPVRTPATEDNIYDLRTDTSAVNYGRSRMYRVIEQWMNEPGLEVGSSGFLLVLGIDRFTMYNEAFGARIADEIIEKTGERLRQVVANNAEIARIDGHIFGLLFHSAQHEEIAVLAKYIIRNLYDYPLETSHGNLTVGASIGGFPLQRRNRMDPAGIVTNAEMAMYKARERGPASFVSFDEVTSGARDTRSIIKTGDDFLRALREKRVKLAFQPVMDMSDSKVSFHEALIRMVDENGKLQSAGQFIPAIEKLGMSRVVDQFALKAAIDELSLFSDLSLSVNVAPQTLNDPEWLRMIVAALRDRPSVAQRLIVEITETTAIASMESVIKIVRTLQDLGCRVALDDFGSGYTAFLQMKALDVDIVKIDKAFIRSIGEEQSQLFIRTLQSLASGVRVKTVGEGAETLAEAKLLADDGVNYVQGYVFGFPQVERVWLPREHAHRKIALDNAAESALATPDAFVYQMSRA